MLLPDSVAAAGAANGGGSGMRLKRRIAGVAAASSGD